MIGMRTWLMGFRKEELWLTLEVNVKVFPKMQGFILDLPGGTVVKNLLDNAGYARDVGLILESGRSLGVGNGNPLQYSCLENPMDREAWWATVHGVVKSWTRRSD